MKVKIICKSVIVSHSIYSHVHYGVNQGSTGAAAIENFIKDAMEWFGYKKDYEKTLEFVMKDASHALRFFTPRQWGLGIDGYSVTRKFIDTEYSPIKNFIDNQHKLCNTVIDAINNKYKDNKFNLVIEDTFTPEFILEPEDFFRGGDDLNSFGTVKFIFSIYPKSRNTPFHVYQDEYKDKMERVLNTYKLKKTFEVSENVRNEICPIFEILWSGWALEPFKKSCRGYLIDGIYEKLNKVGEKFKEDYPEFVEKYEINFQKTLDVRVEYPLNDSDIEEITVNENKSVL